MPHFEFLKDKGLDSTQECYFRSALHLTQARKIIDRGEIQHGIAVLYDSLLNAARFCLFRDGKEPPGEDELLMNEIIDFLPDGFSFNDFQKELENALDGEFKGIDLIRRFGEVKIIVTNIGIPYEENIERIVTNLESLTT